MSEPRYVIILAGGASARFWPLNGEAHPKFLLKPDGATTLIASAFARACTLTSADRVLVVTAETQSAMVAAALPNLCPENIIVEPSRRDTLAATVLGVETVYRRDPQAVAIVTPADGWLEPLEAMREPLACAESAQAFGDGRLFCFGVKPSRPETGFGYVRLGEAIAPSVYRAQRFIEKPDTVTAQELVKDEAVLWNTGSFAWRARDFLAAVQRLEPELLAGVRAYLAIPVNQPHQRTQCYTALRATSVDYGVMERAPVIGVLRMAATFDDVGTWDALAACAPLKGGRAIQVESRNCEASVEGTVAFVGCEDLIVVQHGDDLLVMRKGQGQLVKQAAKRAQA